MCIIAGVQYCACGCVDGAGRIRIGRVRSGGTNVQDGLGFSCGTEMGAVLVDSERATGAPGGSERESLVVLTLFVVTERLDRAIEEAGVDGCVAGVERKVEYL